MATNPPSRAKEQVLRQSGTFNARAEQVQERLFQESDFFDPHDSVQVKYEMVRAIEKEDRPVARAARDFGLSRPSVYEAKERLAEEGMVGLLPQKRGPRRPYKLTEEVLGFAQESLEREPNLKWARLGEQIKE